VRNHLSTEANWEDEPVAHVPEHEAADVNPSHEPAQDRSGSPRAEHAESAAATHPAEPSESGELRPQAEEAEDEITAAMGRRATREELESQPDLDPADLLWVRNDDRLVGPVTAALLFAGIAAGRVPRGSEVLNVRERIWRPLALAVPFAQAFRELDTQRIAIAPARCGRRRAHQPRAIRPSRKPRR